MASHRELEAAFDAAIGQVAKCLRAGMKTVGGETAQPYLEKLEQELEAERDRALKRGSVDREWFQTVVRQLVEWVPESELTLIAAMGRIARVRPTTPPKP